MNLNKIINTLKFFPFYLLFAPFWFSNGIVDKFYGVFFGTYAGDSWAGWKEYIAGNWAKKPVTDFLLVPFFDYLFPVLMLLQALPFILLVVSFIKMEFMPNKPKLWLKAGILASLFVTSAMCFSQTLAGTSDVQYLFQFWGVSLLGFWYVENQEKIILKETTIK
ncbi:hypothetical protein UB37_04400 [Photobacterium iliopiscarium]|uniref:DUF2919 domain-containing protein n=1 Tax=Photobacterium iliopiscarium TaxID=56192 RepID=A0A0D8Q3J3_9GAMM|nr:hypothetical protein [Photobacterium iliopiscarium]KJG24737.1 hypothetical protein UB37_04400 [Photobacterium iliopiscarium]PST97308.1 hypothetical protein C9I87_02410 [Photobacterium iliopiscarium]PSV89822.1 hypothetical protein C9I88_18660 [Photobacterium iliopiscarium]PSW99593.1 hypothetical protein C9J52_02060 [Photobacterium iliopiscarium]